METSWFAQFSWMEMWRPIWALVLILLAVVYVYAIQKTKPDSLKGKHVFYFFVGLALIYGVMGTPLHLVATNLMFSAYMLQASVMYLAAPPLLILGLPSEWLTPMLNGRGLEKTLRVLTYPWMTAILFNVGFTIYLLPKVFQPIHAHPMYEALCEIFFFCVAVLMWWSITSPLPELNPLSGIQRVFYLFITSIMLIPIAVIILFADTVLYPAYVQAQNSAMFADPKYDQQIGAGILKIFQLLSYWVALGVVCYNWVNDYKKKSEPADVIPFPNKSEHQSRS